MHDGERNPTPWLLVPHTKDIWFKSKKQSLSAAVEDEHKKPILQRWGVTVVVTPLVTVVVVGIVSMRMTVKAVVMVLVVVIVRA